MAQIIQPFEQSKHPECKTDCSQGQAAVQDEYPADGTARFKFGAIVDFRHAPHSAGTVNGKTGRAAHLNPKPEKSRDKNKLT